MSIKRPCMAFVLGLGIMAAQAQPSSITIPAPIPALEEAVAEIGPEGGTLGLPGVTVTVPAGAVAEQESFALQRLASPPAPLTGDVLLETEGTADAYSISSSAEKFAVPLSLEFHETAPTEDMVIGSYVYKPTNSKVSPSDSFDVESWVISQYWPFGHRGEGGNSSYTVGDAIQYLYHNVEQDRWDTILLIKKSELAKLRSKCIEKGGTFNGVWCMEPWDPKTDESDGVSVMSLQAGNADAIPPDACKLYSYRLCKWGDEVKVREFIQKHNPDIIAIQEAFNRLECLDLKDQEFVDKSFERICGPFRDYIKSDYPEFLLQTDRIFHGSPYDVACREYECVAIKRTKFEFVDREADYLNGRPNPIIGREGDPDCTGVTGFQVVRIRPKSFPGPIPSPFTDIDIANAHLESPGADADGSCRSMQLGQLFERYKQPFDPDGPIRGTPEDAWMHPTLVMGDFNVDPYHEIGGVVNIPVPLREVFMRVFAWKETPLDNFIGGPIPEYYLGNHNNTQLFYLQLGPGEDGYDDSQVGAMPLTLDHVASNFAATRRCFREDISFSSLGTGAFDHKSTMCELAPFGTATVQAYIWERDPAGTVSPHPTTHNIQAEARHLGVRLRPQLLAHPSSQQPQASVDLYLPSGHDKRYYFGTESVIETEVTYTVIDCIYKPRSSPITIPTLELDPGGAVSLGEVYIALSPMWAGCGSAYPYPTDPIISNPYYPIVPGYPLYPFP